MPITDKFKPDKKIEAVVEKYTHDLSKMLDSVCGYSETELEGRFEVIRNGESNLGNFICDLILTEFNSADIVILNSGTLRSNCVTPAGPITLKTVS